MKVNQIIQKVWFTCRLGIMVLGLKKPKFGMEIVDKGQDYKVDVLIVSPLSEQNFWINQTEQTFFRN